MFPAVAGSTGLVIALAAGAASSEVPPPHPTRSVDSSTNPGTTATLRRRVIHISQPLIITRRRPRRSFAKRGPASISDPTTRRHSPVAADQHREMQMVASRQACCAAAPELPSLFHAIARLHIDGREMRAQRLDSESMVDDHAVAVDAEIGGEQHDAVVGRDDR